MWICVWHRYRYLYVHKYIFVKWTTRKMERNSLNQLEHFSKDILYMLLLEIHSRAASTQNRALIQISQIKCDTHIQAHGWYYDFILNLIWFSTKFRLDLTTTRILGREFYFTLDVCTKYSLKLSTNVHKSTQM